MALAKRQGASYSDVLRRLVAEAVENPDEVLGRMYRATPFLRP